MEDHDQNLREKAKLLLQRERELFELRLKHEQTAVWLGIGQELPAIFLTPSASLGELWTRVRKLLITRLRLQRVCVFEVSEQMLRPLAPAGPDRASPAELRALLAARVSGWCNDPAAESDVGLAALARGVGLHRFIWSRVTRVGAAPIVIAAGFDESKAVFQSPFVSGDADHFANAVQHMGLLLGNAVLIAELELEKVQLRQANGALEDRDRALHVVAEQLRAANETLEQRVAERTEELAEKNRELRLVLDNVDQALITVDLDGRLAPECSTIVNSWFGSYVGTPLLGDYLAGDPGFGPVFALGLEALREDYLPREISLEQMPRRLVMGERHFECRFLPIEEGNTLVALLMVVDDVTAQLARARDDAIQRETLAVFTSLMRDRDGFLLFFSETEGMLARLSDPSLDRVARGQILHTLKGNAGCLGLRVMAQLCHHAESELENANSDWQEALAQLQTRWTAVVQTLRAVVPARRERTLELSEPELAELIEQARRADAAPELVAGLERLRYEPIERPLRRLGQQAQAVAARLGRRELTIQIDADDIRLNPADWAPLWLALVHLVRNAVDHGIEASEERERAGKPASGQLFVTARRLGKGYRLQLGDDGRGIDWDGVARRCVEMKRPAAVRADLVKALLSPGFTTREDVTETSGRGLGLAALSSVVQQLSGTLAVESEPRLGARWTLTFPELSVAR